MEKGAELPIHRESLHPAPHTLGGHCFWNKQDILIEDTTLQKTFQGLPIKAAVGDLPQSIIYLPLIVEGRGVGVITVQSFEANAYSAKHVGILKTLASYIAIAVENANSYAVIKEKNNQITDSLRYARTIQQAMLPSQKQMSKHFPHHFAFYAPKDIVSGDFYWFSHIQVEGRSCCFVAAVDCTGHGVPGAFMSMIGFSVLNEIVKEKKVLEPAQILELLDTGLRSALRQEEKANEDGMDIAIVRIERLHTGQVMLTGAGAKRSSYVWHRGEMQKLQSTNRAIGGQQRKDRDFEQHACCLDEAATLYLFTDGFGDQANEAGARYGSTALLALLQQNAHLPFADQEAQLRQAFEAFKGEAKQRDDVTVLGLRIEL
jgi:serine phosphatase RsbU (regulator of sigma subunit)